MYLFGMHTIRCISTLILKSSLVCATFVLIPKHNCPATAYIHVYVHICILCTACHLYVLEDKLF